MKHMIYVSCFTLFDEKFRKTSKLHLTIVFFFYLFNVSRETFCGLVFLWNLISIKTACSQIGLIASRRLQKSLLRD